MSGLAGSDWRPLSKVVSGGELSRISLAIQVVTSACSAVPTLIFDEVDVGIGGGVAEVVGRLLAKLGEQRQVLCVTHLPQVAACAGWQWQVSKKNRPTPGGLSQQSQHPGRCGTHRRNCPYARWRGNYRPNPGTCGGDAAPRPLNRLDPALQPFLGGAVRATRINTFGIEAQVVRLDAKAQVFCDGCLLAFDFRIAELHHAIAL